MKIATSLLGLAILSLPLASHADERIWLGGIGSWGDPAKWEGNVLPTEDDDAVVGNGGTAILGVGVSGTANELIMGFETSGSLEVSGGTLSVVESLLGFSQGRTAVATISSGTWQTENSLVIGYGSSGTLTMTGGSLSAATSTIGDLATGRGVATIYAGIWANTGELHVGSLGNGTFNIFGGAVSTSKMWIATEGGSTGVANLSGGIVEATAVAEGQGSATLNFDGGTLRALADSGDFLQGFEEGDVTLNGGGAIINSNGYDIVINTVLTGTSGLTKIGYNSLTLTGSNSYTGGTSVNFGKLVLGDATREGRLVAGLGTAAVTLAGGDLEVVRGTITGGAGAQGTTRGDDGNAGVLQNAAGSITNSGTIRGGQGGAAVFTGVGAVTGGDGGAGLSISSATITSNRGLIQGGTGGNASTGLGASFGGRGGAGVYWTSSGTLINSGTIAGGTGGMAVIQGTGGAGVLMSGGGTVENSEGGTITGGASSGGLSLGVQVFGAAGKVVNKGTIIGGVFMGDFANEVTLHTGSLIVNGSLYMGTGTSSQLTLDGSGSQNLSTAVGNALTFAGSVTKTGSGTWTIDRGVSASGGVTIEAGTLVITDPGSGFSVLGTGGVTVEENGKLAGTGPILGNSSVAGVLAPGNSIDELQFGADLFLEDTATVQIELSSLNLFDSISVDGLLTYDGTLSISLLGGYLPDLDDSFAIFDPGSIVPEGAFDHIVFDVAGYEGVFNGSTGVLTIIAVPEPSAAALVTLASLTLLRRRRS